MKTFKNFKRNSMKQQKYKNRKLHTNTETAGKTAKTRNVTSSQWEI